MENLRSRIDVKHVSNEKDYLKCTSRPSYMSHKLFDNNLAKISKNTYINAQQTYIHWSECVFWN